MKRAESRLWAVSWAAGQASLLTGVISSAAWWLWTWAGKAADVMFRLKHFFVGINFNWVICPFLLP